MGVSNLMSNKAKRACERPLGKDYILIVSEKPKAGAAISKALSSEVTECRESGVPYWIIELRGKRYVVASTAGHLFSLFTRKRGFPVFEYEWVPRWEAERGASHLKKFYRVLSKLAKGASQYINACDYDIEGSVIGYMIINMLGNGSKSYRMKYSSLAPEELRSAFSSLSDMDWEMIEAGICRHELDWIWGINVSRLLSWVTRLAGEKKILSSGRVQGPTLTEAVDRYIDYMTFISTPKFSLKVELRAGEDKISATHEESPFDNREVAKRKKENILKGKKGIITSTERSLSSIRPPPAFNLSELQYEASRIFGFSPSYTQRLAEELYLDALISYPRTNSEKLPSTIPHEKILSELSSMESYRSIAISILKTGKLSPVQGTKEDPAHPAIYPTGKRPSGLKRDSYKLYDLIARRYMAAFMDEAKIERVEFHIRAGGENLIAQARSILKPGWTLSYPFSIGREKRINVKEGSELEVSSARISSVLPGKPKMHTKVSLLKWMETENIGTEATRAQIIDTLFKRGYLIYGKDGVKPTKLGMAVTMFLKEKLPDITKTELTRQFEERLFRIRKGEEKREDVVGEARRFITEELERAVNMEAELRDFMKMYLRPEVKCEFCEMPALEGGLCLIHHRALIGLADAIEKWEAAFNEDRDKVLAKIAKSTSVGKAIRDVAKGVIEKRIIL